MEASLTLASSVQQRMWLLHSLDNTQSLYHITRAFRIQGRLRKDLLNIALRRVVDRHGLLRVGFRFRKGDLYYHQSEAYPGLDVQLTERGIAASTAKQLLEQWARKPFDLEAGPLMRTLILSEDSESHYLVFAFTTSSSTDGPKTLFMMNLATFITH